MKDFYKIAVLFRKFRTHSISEEEVEELRVWLQDRKNRKLFNRLMKGDREVQVMRELRKYNTSKAFCRFVGQVHPKKRNIGYYGQIAAAIVLPLIAGVLILWWANRNVREEVLPLTQSMPTIPAPGVKKAVLTLENGMKMALGNGMEEEIVSEEGARLKIDSTGLVYKMGAGKDTSKINKLFVPRRGEYNLTLSDGTRVFLNSDSRLIYPVAFGKDKREVILQGEGYFDVAKDSSRPFLVKTDDLSVRVLGTAFNLKCYPGDSRVEATLVRGSVKVLEGNIEMLLSPGEQARFDRESGEMDKLQVNTALYTSWKDGLFIFERERLEDILTVLSRWYDVAVFYQRTDVKDELFTGDLKKYGGIEEHLKMLEMTTNVKFEIHENTIIVK
ncbi:MULTISPECIES: FecR family protein [Butyricimonas]|uniref:FecR family protein n=1 Tax=Butyricimonas TaxID=574697 RepID=UPI0007FB231D|nr:MULTISPECIES: FecR family protein [Butyricimonas]